MRDAPPACLLFDFTDPRAVEGWQAIDDRVMGGLSVSRLRHDPAGHAVFEGVVSLARKGGFASVRSTPGPRGMAGALACWIELRGAAGVDGPARRFKLSLLTDDGFDSVQHQAVFMPDAGDSTNKPPARPWQTLRLPLADFRASFRGRAVPGAPALDPARIRQIGLMTADRQAGAFALALRRIALA